MKLQLTLGGLAAASLLTLGLAFPTQDAGEPTRAQQDFARLKAMAGDWEGLAPDGTVMGRWTYRVTAGGSALVETIFAGSEHEMLTVYHMEGDELVLTHYCVLGNQPHMHADADAPEGTIRFEATHVGNLGAETNPAMKQGTLVFHEDGTVSSTWNAFAGDEPTMTAGFRLRRVTER